MLLGENGLGEALHREELLIFTAVLFARAAVLPDESTHEVHALRDSDGKLVARFSSERPLVNPMCGECQSEE